ncbi:hypothetical protein ETB97_005197 [Aspergillus alliaceus]|uniref:Beta-lactamase-related domain-containing protein n=1 Tax=Petromyces alliaceus TaxID=209559 RepID=A0A8H6E499_PETAA|nr:hypothetical protein ETB97_005197 [Aspergillus burnettii]
MLTGRNSKQVTSISRHGQSLYHPHTSQIHPLYRGNMLGLVPLPPGSILQHPLYDRHFIPQKDKNLTPPGAERVEETSCYRIASIRKNFTVLGLLQQHAAGNLSLEDTVDKYIPQLRSLHDNRAASTGSIQWDRISLRSLASQLSSLPREWIQGDLFTDPDSVNTTTKCDSDHSHGPCTAQILLDNLVGRSALFAPNIKLMYSSLAFELLGLELANVTGTTYEEYITTSVLHPLGISHTSFSKPPDRVPVLPKGNAWYFDVD